MTGEEREAVLSWPDRRGYFGPYGGQFVPETLVPALRELESLYESLRNDASFQGEYHRLLTDYAGRPTPLTFAARLTAHFGKGRVYLKREDLCHTGAHKINNTVGQILLAMRSGKTRIIAETGAGQHGVATATVAAKMGLDCCVYMGEEDVARQRLNVRRMEMLGATVVTVRTGSRTLKDATSEAIRDWVSNVRDTFYIIGSVVGPHPYPLMVRDFQSEGSRVPPRLRGGGEQRDRSVPSLSGLVCHHDGRRGGGRGTRHRAARRDPDKGAAGRASRFAQLSPAGRERAGAACAFDLRGTGLPRSRPGAQRLEGFGESPLCLRYRLGSA